MNDFVSQAETRIRPERPEDYESILKITYEAFLTLDYPGRRRADEHYLIHLLQNSPFVIRKLCFVAERDGELVGHILYTQSEVMRPDGSRIPTVTFGPLSVLPKTQRQGIGAALVRHSLQKARELGFGAVLITGVPEYYPKLGFKRAREYGLFLEDGIDTDAFMAYELTSGYLDTGGVLRFLPPEFEMAEKDDAGYEAFHKRFMDKYFLNYGAEMQPGKDEIAEFIASPLWENLNLFLQENYEVEPSYSYSTCSGQPGWNVKYQKSGRSLCTLYPMFGYFIALVVIGNKEEAEAELLMPSCTLYTQKLFENVAVVMGGRWLMIHVTDAGILEDVKHLIQLRRKIKRRA